MATGDDIELLVGNEFAAARVRVRQTGHGLRLEITDDATGFSSLVDPLELVGMAWAPVEEFARFADPSKLTQWKG
jgi:hypothetical protein